MTTVVVLHIGEIVWALIVLEFSNVLLLKTNSEKMADLRIINVLLYIIDSQMDNYDRDDVSSL